MHLVVNGSSDARSMVSGYKFTLTDHYREDMNTSYLLTDIEHSGHTSSYRLSAGQHGRPILQFFPMYSCLGAFSASTFDSPSGGRDRNRQW